MKRNRGTDMENVEHFGTLTERMKEFREEVLDENLILMHNVQF